MASRLLRTEFGGGWQEGTPWMMVRRLAVGEDSEIEVALDEFAPAGARRVIATALVVEVDE